MKLAIIATLAWCTCAHANWNDDWQTVPFDSLTEEEGLRILRGEPNNIVVEFREGMMLPVQFFLNGDVLEFHQKDEITGTIVVKKTFYMRHEECGIMYSGDLNSWHPLYMFLTGSIQAGINLDDDVPVLRIDVNHEAEVLQ